MQHNQLAFLIHPRLAYGAEQIARQIATMGHELKAFPYPPTDIIRLSAEEVEIQMALAGYDENGVEVTTKGNQLSVTGKAADQQEDVTYLAKGISRKDFHRVLEFAHPVEAQAHFKNGMLIIRAKSVIPEAEKPRKVSISTV
ncbi:Hsp20 family protein [Pseudomonas putida]|uniref:Hsp20 family protein n=1 Tax=Pseudomonas putida TaxID=303 RepID=A0A8I1ECW7_PSEPU|nr:Hsp20 family protein [Pseudomonas putida]MBI6883211.1 Hsp20 family protein [Pseudomonas putida]